MRLCASSRLAWRARFAPLGPSASASVRCAGLSPSCGGAALLLTLVLAFLLKGASFTKGLEAFEIFEVQVGKALLAFCVAPLTPSAMLTQGLSSLHSSLLGAQQQPTVARSADRGAERRLLQPSLSCS